MEEEPKPIAENKFKWTSDNTEKITKVFPILFLLLFLVGFLKEFVYFYFFGINIINFISWDEIIFVSLDSLLNFFIINLIWFIMILFSKVIERLIPNKRLDKIKRIINFFFGFIAGGCFYYFVGVSEMSLTILILTSVPVIAISKYLKSNFTIDNVVSYFYYKNINRLDFSDLIRSYIIISFFIIIISNIAYSFLNYYSVTRFRSKNPQIIFQDDNKLTGKHDYFIGQTANYLFFYNDSAKEKRKIIPIDKVLSISF